MDRLLATLLCWSSYLVGMELPVESSPRLYCTLRETEPFPRTMVYCASVVSVDSRFGQVVIDVSLLNGGSAVASGQCCSFLCHPVAEVDEIDSKGVRPDSLAGRSAVIVGSSRGLDRR